MEMSAMGLFRAKWGWIQSTGVKDYGVLAANNPFPLAEIGLPALP
jgi:hypothetical protein